jgi:hypothetical protein
MTAVPLLIARLTGPCHIPPAPPANSGDDTEGSRQQPTPGTVEQ